MDSDAPIAARSAAVAAPLPAVRRWLSISPADWLELTKPRMNALVVATTAAGFCLASRGDINWGLLLQTVIGTALTAGAASALNQYLERQPDARMRRTARRPLPGRRIDPAAALVFGILLGVGGTLHLALAVNPLTAWIGLATLVVYVGLYTPLKRLSTLCTLVGAVSGALPPVMGWTAATHSLSAGAVALFLILFLWQMPHFLAIAILYRDQYAAAGFRMLPVVDPALGVTSRQIVLYTLALLPASLIPVQLNIARSGYMLGAGFLGLAFLSFAMAVLRRPAHAEARCLFLASIIYLPLLFILMLADKSA